MPKHSSQENRVINNTQKNLPNGIKLLHTLEKHKNIIGRIAWSPNGHLLASPSFDGTVKLWDAEKGIPLKTLGSEGTKLFTLAFDSEGKTLAYGGEDGVITLYDIESGMSKKFQDEKIMRFADVHSLAFLPQKRILATASQNGTVLFWDTLTGIFSHVFQSKSGETVALAFNQSGTILAVSGDHQITIIDVSSKSILYTLKTRVDNIYGIAFNNQMIAAGGSSGIIQCWDIANGKIIRNLEGHTAVIDHLQFYPGDDRLLVSKSNDDTVKLWRCDTWDMIAEFSEPKNKDTWWPGTAFHPVLPILATVGSHIDSSQDERDQVIHIWELDLNILLDKRAAPIASYTSAKVVLLGESNIGKSYLAHRIFTGSPPIDGTINSTHGMKFWSLKPQQLNMIMGTSINQNRDIVLWDMGGQDEYRLIHQLFIHDTTIAVVLFDPTRGASAFKEAEMWNKYLDKQLQGRQAVKLLVGAKQDQHDERVDLQAVERLVREGGFLRYIETSAITGRGIAELCETIAQSIDWDDLEQTSRPELFQHIRDAIKTLREKDLVVLSIADLCREIGIISPSDVEFKAISAVTKQLASQGVIALSQVTSGEKVIILQVEQIERYAGSLIVAARNNPRGVPALELKDILQINFSFPGINSEDRLHPDQERPILECIVQLMLEHGICFQHEGLLIFPSLFASTAETTTTLEQLAVSLYYDFAGAIDNIYASLIAWLVLAQDFGHPRLWSDRAEFDDKAGGFCGLRKITRPGGFAHMDVYFHANTPEKRKKLFISCVEEHLQKHGVEIREQIVVPCPKNYPFDEETLRMKIAEGAKDVLCPRCEERHNLTQGVADVRKEDPRIIAYTWALKTEIEKRRKTSKERAIRVLNKTPKIKQGTRPIRILHLSDLHFNQDTPIKPRLQWLLDDIKNDNGLGFKELDYLVISGDFTDRGNIAGFEKAYDFVSGLIDKFSLSAQRCIFVPGNHDVIDPLDAYERRKEVGGLKKSEWIPQGSILLARNADKYRFRFKPFSDELYHKLLQRSFPLDYSNQGIAIPFWETGIQFITLNSCWQIDEFHRDRAGIFPDAVANAINEAQEQERIARSSGQLKIDKPILRIGVWHHSVTAPDYKMADLEFLDNLQKNNVKLALHGDVHEMRREVVRYWRDNKLHVIGAGSFGAQAEARPESTPRLYNVIEIKPDFTSIRVHTRQQITPNGSWGGWYQWPSPDRADSQVAYYDLNI